MSDRKTAGRKPRMRVGADQARAWARELDLRNPYAKAILLAIANYMNEDGAAWPGTATIARDTDISEDTVVRRLRWLASVGAIALFKCWRDENGQRNYEGRGKPTSNEIRFLFDADKDEIEARARGEKTCEATAGDDESSPRTQRELSEDVQPPVSSRLAPDQPPQGERDSGRHIDSEQELESHPQTPSDEGAFERLDEFAKTYPIPISDFERTKLQWAALTDQERDDAITGARGYASLLKSQPKRTAEDAHRWLKNRKWQGYVSAGKRAETALQRFNGVEGSPQWECWDVFYRCCGGSGIPGFLITGPEGQRVANLPREWPPIVHDPNRTHEWQWVTEEDRGEFAAWLRRLREFENVRITLRSIIVGGKSVQALHVPYRWPPNKTETTAA